MKKKLIISLIAGLLSLFAIVSIVPFAVFAAPGTSTTRPTPPVGFTVRNIMNNIITPVWEFFVGLAVIMFIVAGILFVTANGEPGKITTAKNAFIWGVVGIVVAIVAFSIVGLVSGWV